MNAEGRELVDYILVDGTPETPMNVRGKLELTRNKFFDLEVHALPIIAQSHTMLGANNMSEQDKHYIDYAELDLQNPNTEKRFRTEFDFYAALIRAAEDNADLVATQKRKITRHYHTVNALYNEIFYQSLNKYGSKTMGSNKEERIAWMETTYPALAKIKQLYDDFLEEVDIELERWKQYISAASRGLTAVEDSYKATGRFYDVRSGKYDS